MPNSTKAERSSSDKMIFILLRTVMACVAFAATAQYVEADTLQAVTPAGQLISFVLPNPGGQTTVLCVCGIHVKKLAYEYRDFVFVRDLKLVGNKMECTYGPFGQKTKPSSVKTTFTDVDFSSGHIRMTVAAVPLSEPNRKYELTLTSPFQGEMVPLEQAPKLNSQAKKSVPADGGEPPGSTGTRAGLGRWVAVGIVVVIAGVLVAVLSLRQTRRNSEGLSITSSSDRRP